MSQKKSERKKKQKSQQRRKEIARKRNIEHCVPKKRFRLDGDLNGKWALGLLEFNTLKQVSMYKARMDEAKDRGDVITEAQIVDRSTGKVVLDIQASKPKGAAPDKIADGKKAKE